MKVLVADRFEQSGIDGLTNAGCDVSYQPDLNDAALAEVIRETRADVLVVRGTPVTAAMLEGADADVPASIWTRPPSDALLQAIRAGSGDILDVHVHRDRGS